MLLILVLLSCDKSALSQISAPTREWSPRTNSWKCLCGVKRDMYIFKTLDKFSWVPLLKSSTVWHSWRQTHLPHLCQQGWPQEPVIVFQPEVLVNKVLLTIHRTPGPAHGGWARAITVCSFRLTCRNSYLLSEILNFILFDLVHVSVSWDLLGFWFYHVTYLILHPLPALETWWACAPYSHAIPL